MIKSKTDNRSRKVMSVKMIGLIVIGSMTLIMSAKNNIGSSKGAEMTYVVPSSTYFKPICKTMHFNQTIKKKGCGSIVMQNHYCIGQCNSLYVPTNGEMPLRVCSNCIPHDYKWIRVVLSCPDRKRKFREKLIFLILSCKCQSGRAC